MKNTPYKINSIVVTYKKTVRSTTYYMSLLERIDRQVQSMKDCKQANDILANFQIKL